MSFTKFQVFKDDTSVFVENVINELQAAGITPNLRNSISEGSLGEHIEKIPNSDDTEAVFIRRVDSWGVEFQRKEWGCRLDETLVFKEFSERNDVRHWGVVSQGWATGYTLQTPEALSAFTKLLREEPMHLMNSKSDNR